ncbi:PilW family protein [Methyloprofundus sp.]|uniref:PilW family protein n=1 Tax=Methyloprofundus sp. TaxID=2020875 RepID=UPI003D09A387
MIASAFGMVVTAGAITIFLAIANSNRDVLNAIKLNQELRGAMSFMVRDLRRAGSWNYANAAAAALAKGDPPPLTSSNPFNQAGQITGTPACDPVADDCTYTCIEFTYDLSGDGAHNGNSELFGIGLKDNAIKTKVADKTCPDMDGWQGITDDSVVNITNFQIIDLFPASYDGTQIRLLEIRLTGELVKDSSVKRDLVEFVRIRNDFLEP